MRRAVFTFMISLALVTSSCHESGPVAPSVPDLEPANPDSTISVVTDSVQYSTPATVHSVVRNRSAGERYVWAQCFPSVEHWEGGGWHELAFICTGEAAEVLPAGASTVVVARVGPLGYYRTVVRVSSASSGIQVYRSATWKVE
jgi:hypothetical protein